MIKVTIKAEDKDGKLLGTSEEEKPETMAELLALAEEKDIVSGYWKSYVIDVQRELRNKARGPVKDQSKAKITLMIEEARKQKAAGDSGLYDQLVSLDIIKE